MYPLINKSTSDNKSIKENLKSSGGYVLVSLLATFTGYLLAFQYNSNLTNILYFFSIPIQVYIIFAFSILLVPYLYKREVLLEREQMISLKDGEIFLKEIPTFFFYGLIILYIVVGYFLLYDKLKIDISYLIQLLILFFLSILPFVFLHHRANKLINNNKIDLAYSFSESILLPSLFICIISFAFGWSIAGESINFGTMITTIIFIILISIVIIYFDGYSTKKNFKLLIGVITLYLLFLFICCSTYEYFNLVLSSLLLTLTMGVSEVTQRINLVSEGKRYISKRDNYIENKEFYFNGGKSAAMSIPLLLPLLSLFWDNLSVKIIYIIPAMQIIHWAIIIRKNNVEKIDFRIALGFGFLLPLLIMIMSQYNITTSFIDVNGIEGKIVFWGLSAMSFMAYAFYRYENKENIDKNFLVAFHTLLATSFFLILIAGKHYIMNPELSQKFYDIGYITLLLNMAIFYILIHNTTGKSDV